MNEDAKKFGAKVHYYRKLNKLTLQELAEKCGYTSKSTVSKIEKGVIEVSRSKVAEIANALNVSPLDLLGYRNEEYSYLIERLKKLPDGKREMAAKLMSDILKTFEGESNVY